MNDKGEIQATVSLLDQEDTLLFEDIVNLSRADDRQGMATILRETFGIEDAESQLLTLLEKAREELEKSSGNDRGPSQGSHADKLVNLAVNGGGKVGRAGG